MSVCVWLPAAWSGLGFWALVVVVELVCEVECVGRDGGRTAVHVHCHVTAVCLPLADSPHHHPRPPLSDRRPSNVGIGYCGPGTPPGRTRCAPGGGGVLEESDIVVVVLPACERACNYRSTTPRPQPPCNC